MSSKSKLIFTLTALVLACCMLASSVFAWFVLNDYVLTMELYIAKIDSNISVYKAIDSNFNGIPDKDEGGNYIFGAPDDSVAGGYIIGQATFTSAAYTTGMQMYFDTAKMQEAMTIVDFMPTQIALFKINVENNSEANNRVRFEFAPYSISNDFDGDGVADSTFTQGEIDAFVDFLKVLSVRVGYDIDGNGTPEANEFSQKIFFANHVTGGNITGIFDMAEVEILGSTYAIGENLGKNIIDFWFEFEFETLQDLDTFVTIEANKITQQQYELLKGQTVTFPLLRVFLEIMDNT